MQTNTAGTCVQPAGLSNAASLRETPTSTLCRAVLTSPGCSDAVLPADVSGKQQEQIKSSVVSTVQAAQQSWVTLTVQAAPRNKEGKHPALTKAHPCWPRH
jgi:hypothetical protein